MAIGVFGLTCPIWIGSQPAFAGLPCRAILPRQRHRRLDLMLAQTPLVQYHIERIQITGIGSVLGDLPGAAFHRVIAARLVRLILHAPGVTRWRIEHREVGLERPVIPDQQMVVWVIERNPYSGHGLSLTASIATCCAQAFMRCVVGPPKPV